MNKAEIVAALKKGKLVYCKSTDYPIISQPDGIFICHSSKFGTRAHPVFDKNDKPLIDLRYVFTNDDYYLVEGSGRGYYRSVENANLAAVNGETVRPVKIRIMYAPTVD